MKTLSIIDAWNENKTSPVKVVSVGVDNQQILSDKPFQASEHWLRDMKFIVQNISQRPIKEIVLRLEVTINGQKSRYYLSIGNSYYNFSEPKDNSSELLLQPGQSASIQFDTFNPRNYQRLLDICQTRGISVWQISNVTAYVLAVVFENTKEGWSHGQFIRRVSEDEYKVVGN